MAASLVSTARSETPRASVRLLGGRPSRRHGETPYAHYLRVMSDDTKGDLIAGEIVVSRPVSVQHERIFGFLICLVGTYVEERGLGARTLVGDLDITERVDIAVEIVSKTAGRRDREARVEGYERLGVPEYWLIDPLRGEAAFYRLGDDGRYRAAPLAGGVFESTAAPGFRLNPQALFADPLPVVLPLLTALLAERLPSGTEVPDDEGTA